jgi:hypothetical protein
VTCGAVTSGFNHFDWVLGSSFQVFSPLSRLSCQLVLLNTVPLLYRRQTDSVCRHSSSSLYRSCRTVPDSCSDCLLSCLLHQDTVDMTMATVPPCWMVAHYFSASTGMETAASLTRSSAAVVLEERLPWNTGYSGVRCGKEAQLYPSALYKRRYR